MYESAIDSFFYRVSECNILCFDCYGSVDPNQCSLNPPLNQESGHEKKDALSKKVIRTTLNQNEPTEVKVGLQRITTLEFPAKIERLTDTGLRCSPIPTPMRSTSPTRKGRTFCR
jgi:hypothetical protein